MPTAKTSRRSNRRGRRNNQRSSTERAVGAYASDAWSLARRTAQGLSQVRRLINVEHKFHDVNDTLTTSQNGFVHNLSNISQGDDISNREGDSIRIQSIEIKGTVFRSATATANEAVRIIIVRDLQQQGTAPVGSDILQNVGSSLAPYSLYNQLNSHDLNKRFTFVYDELVSIDQYNPTVPLTFRSDSNCHVYYRGSTTQSGNGNYYMILFSNQSANAANFDFSCRIRFTDN